MGNQVSSGINYSIPLPNSKANKDVTPVYRAASHSDALIDSFVDFKCNTSRDLFLHGLSLGKSRPCIGYRKRCADQTLEDHFTFKTYEDINNEALTLGSFLLQRSLVPVTEFPDEPYAGAKSLKLFGIFSKNCVEWLVCEQAANAYNFSLVPLYESLGESALVHILHETKLGITACSIECLPLLASSIEKASYIKTVLVFSQQHEEVPPSLMDRLYQVGVTTVLFYNAIMEQMGSIVVEEPREGKLDDINTICYTSGTMSNAKGVILTHRNVVSISYLPLAHVLERFVCNLLFYLGASTGVFSGDTTKLLEDISILNPTIFVSVPRLYNRIHDAVTQSVSQKSQVVRFLFEQGTSSKLYKLRQSGSMSNVVWDKVVFKQTKRLLGNRLRYMVYGGAPLDASIEELIKVIFCVPLLAGYGLTETLGPSLLSSPFDPVSGHVGGPIPCSISKGISYVYLSYPLSAEFCVESVPDMSYTIEDNPPRGELLLRGPTVTPGYFRNPDETNTALDGDGWFHTGDIVVLFPNGCVKVIDRKKNIFKLSQGEYIVPHKIEDAYMQSHYISQIFVFGYSDKNYLVAIVVPDEKAIVSIAKKENINESSLKALCNSPKIKQIVFKSMVEIGEQASLKGFEKVRDIYLSPDPFTIENNCLTPTFKIRRHYLKEVYQQQISSMYNDP